MQQLHDLKDEDLQGLAPEAVAALVRQMLQRLRQQDSEIKLKDAKIEKITFELARLKRWKFGAKAEAMSAEQRRLFEETCAEDEADLLAQLEQLKAKAPDQDGAGDTDTPERKRQPRREKLPDDLRRVEHHHEPEDTTCPSTGCGKAMMRVGEDISERLDVIPAEFFVHRHIYGKWACRCCQCLVQEPAEPSIIDGGIPASGLVAHAMVSHFVDHLPYYRLESINARSGVHTPRSTLAQWSGRGGAALVPLYEAQWYFVLSASHLHVDETPVAMLDPGAGKTKRAYVWGYARGAFDPVPGVVYDFCPGRGSQYPLAFLGGDRDQPPWTGTLIRDEYAAYDRVVQAVLGRVAAGCLAHARRKYDELLRDGGRSAVATEALARIAAIYRIERELAVLTPEQRLLTQAVMVRANIGIDAMSAQQKVELADEIYAQQPNLLASILVLPRYGGDLLELEVPIHVLLVAFQAMKHCGHALPTISEDVQETCLQRPTVTMRFTEGVPPDLVEQMITKSCVNHPERYLLAFVYGYLGEHDLLRVRTDAENFLLLAALNPRGVRCLRRSTAAAQVTRVRPVKMG
ncbi:IS66 family transposase [Variovorax guangxiensis]|uniref:IS66 family transposase n=1 Tax=Variovorax guangxiensis TaxID=1775474 RepID=A0A3S0XF40_9BURK|nr:IS66 family transposase [Variovorax guangxiensis]RUR71920.1 IS66 family transposase [Variovorax guangxiensis]